MNIWTSDDRLIKTGSASLCWEVPGNARAGVIYHTFQSTTVCSSGAVGERAGFPIESQSWEAARRDLRRRNVITHNQSLIKTSTVLSASTLTLSVVGNTRALNLEKPSASSLSCYIYPSHSDVCTHTRLSPWECPGCCLAARYIPQSSMSSPTLPGKQLNQRPALNPSVPDIPRATSRAVPKCVCVCVCVCYV